jgi:hypothetical protein
MAAVQFLAPDFAVDGVGPLKNQKIDSLIVGILPPDM